MSIVWPNGWKRTGYYVNALHALCAFRGTVDKIRVEKGELSGRTRRLQEQVTAKIFEAGKQLTSDDIAALIPAMKRNLEKRASCTSHLLAKLDADLAQIGGRK